MVIQPEAPAAPRRTTNANTVPSNEGAIRVLQSFMMEDEIEQRETWEYLKQAFDEDRADDEKLFP